MYNSPFYRVKAIRQKGNKWANKLKHPKNVGLMLAQEVHVEKQLCGDGRKQGQSPCS